jgi:hypothetical protein
MGCSVSEPAWRRCGPERPEEEPGNPAGARRLDAEQWIARADEYAERAEKFVAPHLRRARVGEAHPVWDFLFSYYSLRPGQLRRWHPGYGVVLAGGEAIRRYGGRRGYTADDAGVTVSETYLRSRLDTISFVARLLEATASRPAQLACFGLHEWAMVYRADPEQRRHSVPLRLGQDGTNAVVESMPLRCTHFDAFRFFTDVARPRNAVQLSRADQIGVEQPGCVHAAMDLYKFAGKLLALVDSDLLMDAFELAHEARELDMRASPYDLRAFGYEAIPVESSAGRAEYVRRQAAIASQAAAIRASLQRRCESLLAYAA